MCTTSNCCALYSSYMVVGLKCIYVFRGKLVLLCETEIYGKLYEARALHMIVSRLVMN